MSKVPIRALIVFGILLSMILSHPAPTSAAPATPEAEGVYEEDFTDYASLDEVDRLDWNPFSGTVELRPGDAVPREWADLVSDGTGGVYTVWLDYRNGEPDVYMQHLDGRGNRLWEHDLRVNSDDPGNRQGPPRLARLPDGSALVAWVDGRSGIENEQDIYAQRVTAERTKAWGSDRQLNATSGDIYWRSLGLAVDGSGGAFVSWTTYVEDGPELDTDYNEVYLQRVDGDGTRLWGGDVRISFSDISWTRAYTGVDTDSGDNAVVTWHSGSTIKVHKFSSAGTPVWGSAVTLEVPDVSYGHAGWQPAVAVASSDEIYVAWRKVLWYDIYVHKLSSAGQLSWDHPAQLSDLRHTQPGNRVEIALDGNGGAVVVWDGYEGYEYTLGMWARGIGSDGTVSWESPLRLGGLSDHPAAATGPAGEVLVASDGVRFNRLRTATGDLLQEPSAWVSDASGTVGQQDPSVSYSSSTGVMVGWRSLPVSSSDGYNLRLRPFAPDGTPQWQKSVRANRQEDQVYHSEAYHTPVLPVQTSTSPSGDAFAAWTDLRPAPEGPGGPSARVQRVDTSGNLLWSSDALVDPMGGRVQGIAAMPDGGAVVSYWTSKPVTETWTYGTCLQRLASNGELLWSERVWIADQEEPSEVDLAVADDGSIYVSDAGHIWRFDEAGEEVWRRPQGPEDTVVAVDPAGKVLLVWVEWELDSYVIYAQKLNTDGSSVWTDARRISVSGYGSIGGRPGVAFDEDGYAVAVWEDGESGTIHAQRIDADGNTMWGTDLAVSADGAGRGQNDPSVTTGAAGKAYVAWTDERHGNFDVYLQGLSPDGAHLWASDLQAVSPDFSYYSEGETRSRNVNPGDEVVVEANLTGQYVLQGGNLTFYLSNDGGDHWASVTPGTTHVFTTTGSDLRWRAKMATNPYWRDDTPVLEQLRIEYTTISSEGDDYEPDDICDDASPLQVDGAVQGHTFHEPNDEDWAWFSAQEGTTYVLQTARPGANADTVLELHDVCNRAILTDTNAFGQDARLTFTASNDGTYYARVTNQDGNVHGAGTDYDLSVRTYTPNGLAVVVAGHNDGYQLQSNIDYAADQAYLTLLESGFSKDNVRYLGPSTQRDVDGNGSSDDIAATATVTNVRHAIRDWPREQGLGLGVPFYVYLMDHGHYDLFLANGNSGRVTAPRLDLWLSNLEATTGVDQVTVVIDACKSGSFIDVTDVGPDEISGPNRVVVASTTSQANAYPSAEGSLFSDAFWTAMGDNQDVWTAYRTAEAAVEARDLMQEPWLDDNGDAVANDEDGSLARGRGLAGFFGGGEPVIDWFEVSDVSGSGDAVVRAQVRDDFGLSDVYVEVYPPGYEAPEAPAGETPVVDVPTTTLTLMADDVYEGELTGLTETGSYRVVGYAVDDEENWAVPQWTLVTVGQDEQVYLPLVIRSNRN